MIKVSESDKKVIENELIFCKNELNDYLSGQTISFKNIIISLEDVLDFFLHGGHDFKEYMRNDTRILFRK